MKKLYGLIMVLVLVNLFADEPPPQFEYRRYYEDFLLDKRFNGVFYPELESTVNALEPNTGGDGFHEFQLPESFTKDKTDEEIDKALYRRLLAFSSQKGIKYYSYRRKTYRVFIEECYAIESLDNRTRKSDTTISDDEQIPSLNTFYVFQKDSSFGEGARKIDIKYDKEAHQFYIKIINEDTIKYQGLIPIGDPHKFLLALHVNREGNTIKMYGITATHSKTFGAIKKRISISIVYRIYALANWFENEVLASVSEY